jgi:predicted nucleic acid-binding protein
MTRAVLDACVLFPDMPRELLLAAARAGHLAPLWSDRILEEWRRATLVKRAEDAGVVAAEIARLKADFPAARIVSPPDAEGLLSLPDPDDRHVLATAIAGEAAEIVTFNLGDFPGRTLARHGVIPRHPDSFLTECALGDPAFAGTVAALCAQVSGGPARTLLKREKLPRLGKAVAQRG